MLEVENHKAYPNRKLYTLSLSEQPDGTLISCHGAVGRDKVISCRVSNIVFDDLQQLAEVHKMSRAALAALLLMDSLYRLKLMQSIRGDKPITPIVTDIDEYRRDMDRALTNIKLPAPPYGASRNEVKAWQERNRSFRQ